VAHPPQIKGKSVISRRHESCKQARRRLPVNRHDLTKVGGV